MGSSWVVFVATKLYHELPFSINLFGEGIDNALYFVIITHQMVLPTSSATSSAPRLPMATPTGCPITSPSALMKPIS